MAKKKKVAKIAKKITKAVGAGPLADFASSKIAKRRVAKSKRKFVSDKTTKKRAAKSALATATSLTGAAGLARLAARKAAKKAAKKAAARKARKGTIKVKGQKKPVKVRRVPVNPTTIKLPRRKVRKR